MWGRALLLVLLTALSAGDDGQDQESKLQVGQSVDIFTRYGYLSLSMKAVPVNLTDFNTIFREPSIDVFVGLDPYIVRAPKRKVTVFEGDFHMEFCDNLRQLLQAYFRDFKFDKLDQPWKTFTGSWSKETIAKHMGLTSHILQREEYAYILVRLSRFRENMTLNRLPPNIQLMDVVANEIDKIKVGDFSSVMTFIRKFGSHYISSYVTGNSLYQVFVYNQSNYRRIKFRLKTEGVTNIKQSELSRYFSPWRAAHIGEIKVASGNQSVQAWISQNFNLDNYIFTYASLMKIHKNTSLLSKLNDILQNEALIQIEFKALSAAFKNPSKRQWFDEVLQNLINLWEANF